MSSQLFCQRPHNNMSLNLQQKPLKKKKLGYPKIKNSKKQSVTSIK